MRTLKKNLLRVLVVIPDKIFNTIIFFIKLRYIPRFKNPRSFNEKINYIKLYSNYKLREVVADRIKVRDYVESKNTDCNLVKMLWSGNEFTEKIYNELPNKFVIKANHGSGMVKIVDKSNANFKEISSVISPWLDYEYGLLTRQWVYKNLERKFVIEEFLQCEYDDLPDYKFFCFNGKVEFIQVDLDRFHGHKRNIYDKDFNQVDVQYYFEKGPEIQKPVLLNDAVKIAEKLAEDFDFIRVDLYIMDNDIYFGEMTNTPENGFGYFKPKKFDFEIGEKLNFIKEYS